MDTNQIIESVLHQHLIPHNAYIFGFADLRGLVEKEYKDYPYAISIGKKLNDPIVDTVTDKPTLEYYRHYKEINHELTTISENICAELRENKIKCLGVFPTITSSSPDYELYLTTLRYRFSHKMAGTRAGLGWIGKTDLFVSTAFGPRLRLATVLIDTPVQPLHPAIERSRCGTCEVCMTSCPAQTANGIHWNITTDRDLFFNARKCREQCKKFGAECVDKDALVCGICVSVCPQGKKSGQSD
jgi:epoxyqueuosine reductase